MCSSILETVLRLMPNFLAVARSLRLSTITARLTLAYRSTSWYILSGPPDPLMDLRIDRGLVPVYAAAWLPFTPPFTQST